MNILTNRLKEVIYQRSLRALIPQRGIDMISNDYLGFAQDKILHKRFLSRLHQIPLGASGSRLLGGNLALFEETEHQLAQFVKRQAAILFPSGYQANLALFSALLREGDIVYSDEYNHASIIDGIRLTKAKKIIFPHRDYQFLNDHLNKYSPKQSFTIIVSESLFSMHGTLADLTQLAQLATQFNALLIIDEAHSTAIWGSSLVTTKGLQNQVFATIHTAGKALGAAGAWIAGDTILKNYLINFARPFIFSTAPMPAMLILLQEAMKRYQQTGDYRANIILSRAKQLRNLLTPFVINHDESPIVTIMLLDNSNAIKLSHYLQNRQWQIQAIRPPTVPLNTARIRITVKWCNPLSQLHQFAEDIKNGMEFINT